jgi:hypothetical protein
MRESSLRDLTAAGLLALGISLFVWLENRSVHQFQQCIAAHNAAESARESDQKSSIVVVLSQAGPQSICTIRVLDKHNGFFAALAGLAVALFTFTLWQSSEKMWEAAVAQSRDTQVSIKVAERTAEGRMLAAGADRAWMTFGGLENSEFSNGLISGKIAKYGVILQERDGCSALGRVTRDEMIADRVSAAH